MPNISASPRNQTSAYAASPPTFIKVIKKKEHADFSLSIAQMNAPQTTLQDALIAALPFAVTLRPDAGVDLAKPLSVRVADKMNMKEFLSYIEDLSGYRLSYQPDKKLLTIASRIQKTWHLPTLAGRYQTAISLGEIESGESAVNGDTSSSDTPDAHLSIRSQYRSDQQLEWSAVVQQAHCLLATSECRDQDIAQGDSKVMAYPEQGMLTAISTPDKIETLSKWLDELERNLNRFVHVQVALINIRKSHSHSKGVDFRSMLSSDQDSLQIQYTGNVNQTGLKEFVIGGVLRNGNLSLDGILRLIKENSDSEVVHRASATVASGETALVSATEQFYFASGSEIIPGDAQNNQVVSTNLQEESVGIKLAVTPRFLKPDSEVMSIRVTPSISRLIAYEPIQSNGRVISQAPRISANYFVSHSILRNGNAILIGGLTSQDNTLSKKSFPGGRATSFLDSHDSEFTDSEIAIVIAAQEVEV